MYLSLVLVTLLSAGPGATIRGAPPSPQVPGSMHGAFSALTESNIPTTTFRAPKSGTMVNIHGESTAAGTDVGGGTITISVIAHGGSMPGVKCSVDVACTESRDFIGACSSTFEAGQDLHLEITASSCLSKPTLLVRATWEWGD